MAYLCARIPVCNCIEEHHSDVCNYDYKKSGVCYDVDPLELAYDCPVRILNSLPKMNIVDIHEHLIEKRAAPLEKYQGLKNLEAYNCNKCVSEAAV